MHNVQGNAQKPHRTTTAASDQANANRIPPSLENIRYGPYERNVLDLWQAESISPTPLLVFFHGGAYRTGDKSRFPPALQRHCLESGISFATANYRYSQQAQYPGPMLDGARAVQFLRLNAPKWNLDPARFAAAGGSAGAQISLWIAYHDDRANPESHDPVERQSSRLQCALPVQMTWPADPRDIRKLVPGDAYNSSAIKQLFGLPETWNWDKDKVDAALDARLKDAALVNHVAKGGPPVFILHFAKANQPGNIHHPNFGKHLKQVLDSHGIECLHRLDTDYESLNAAYQDMVEFLKKRFEMR